MLVCPCLSYGVLAQNHPVVVDDHDLAVKPMVTSGSAMNTAEKILNPSIFHTLVIYSLRRYRWIHQLARALAPLDLIVPKSFLGQTNDTFVVIYIYIIIYIITQEISTCTW